MHQESVDQLDVVNDGVGGESSAVLRCTIDGSLSGAETVTCSCVGCTAWRVRNKGGQQ